MRDRWASLLVGTASLAAVLLLWQVAGTYKWVNPVLLPTPASILETLAGLVTNGKAMLPLSQTIALFVTGYGIACVLGVFLGVAMGVSPNIYGLLEPLVEIVRPIPKPALVPALFLFLGIGKVTMVTVIVLAVVFPVLINTLQGVRGLDPVLLDTARTFHVSRGRMIVRVVVPAALPMILAGMRVGLGLGLVLVILAEMLAGESGLGFLILDLQRSFQIKEMFAWIFILMALGGGLTVAFDTIERRLVPWRGRA